MSGGSPATPEAVPGPIRTVCVVGSGGREHALAVTLARTADVVVTPGNPGISGTVCEKAVPEAEFQKAYWKKAAWYWRTAPCNPESA